jgi:hypothetical protein
MGVMQIPEEQRNNVRSHAATSLEKARNLAFEVTDTMSNSCAKVSGTDPSEVVGKIVPNEILDHCGCLPANPVDGEDRGEKSNYHQGRMGSIGDDGHSLTGTDMNFEVRSEGSSPIANAVHGVERGMNRLVGEVFGDDQHHHISPASQPINLVGGVSGVGTVGDIKGRGAIGGGDGHVGLGASGDEDVAGQRVACGRKGEQCSIPEPSTIIWFLIGFSHSSLGAIPPLRSCCSAESNSLVETVVTAASVARRHGKCAHFSR